MNPPNRPTRVIVICEPGSTQQQITAALGSQTDFQLVDFLVEKDKLVRQIRANEPDIILLDNKLNSEPTLDIIDDIALRFPESAIVAILPTNDPVIAQQAMLAGARGFIVQPFTQVNLLNTMQRMVELETRRLQSKLPPTSGMPEATRPLHSLTVFSPRGGAGVTTLAINLAVAMLEETGAKVLLFEGKMFFGHLEAMLNMRTQNTLSDLVPHAASLDEALLRDVIYKHGSGIHVLLAPNNIQLAQGIRPDDIYNIFVAVQRLYDFVVIDAGNALNDIAVTLMDTTDRVILLTNPDLASLQDASRFLRLSRTTLSYPAEKVLIVLNRAGISGGVRQKDIESVLHQGIHTQIPDDPGNVLRSINRGLPLINRYPRSPASRAIRKLANSLLQITLTEMPQEGIQPASENLQHEALMASSRLG